jgi:6-phosphogluconate dehydrogenase
MGIGTHDVGMVGLGVMGKNLVLNMADHGFSVAAYTRHAEKASQFEKEAGNPNIAGARSVTEFVALLKRPRVVMLLVPAGDPVDAVIRELEPLLEPGDLIVDGGNSHFKDTDRRIQALARNHIHFFGVGISGGEKGARFGPSMMPGGDKQTYERVRPVFEAVAARVDGDPCVTYLGPGSAGHYVKMVHNGIEYAVMELISETYHLLKSALRFTNDELRETYCRWNQGDLASFLLEITCHIFGRVDDKTGGVLIDRILDEARQKGTGKWTVQDAMELQVPVPTMDMAVVMRDLSIFKQDRETGAELLFGPEPEFRGDRQVFAERLEKAFHAAMIITYAQGMSLLRHASLAYGYGLNLDDVARIWRGGCIIRAALLEDIRAALASTPELSNLMFHERFSRSLADLQDDLRFVTLAAVQNGIPAPGMASALAYYDGFRSRWLPASLVQAQRDYFGAHTYERIDEDGVFHTEWDQPQR